MRQGTGTFTEAPQSPTLRRGLWRGGDERGKQRLVRFAGKKDDGEGERNEVWGMELGLESGDFFCVGRPT